MADDVRLVNASGTLVTLTDDPSKVDFAKHVVGKNVEKDFRDAGYRDVSPDEGLPIQAWEAHPAANEPSFASRAALAVAE